VVAVPCGKLEETSGKKGGRFFNRPSRKIIKASRLRRNFSRGLDPKALQDLRDFFIRRELAAIGFFDPLPNLSNLPLLYA
jgi:hypothetical protein